MTVDEFEQYLALGYESRGVEFKGPAPRSNGWMFAKTLRAMMGMANRRDGGYVFVGVDEKGKTPNPVGLNASDLATWNYDDFAAAVAPYAAPNIKFDLEVLPYKGAQILIVRVHEFEDVPVICRKEAQYADPAGGKIVHVLKSGACYVRSRAKPETAEVSTEADMRDLIDLAVDKDIQRFMRRATSAGFSKPADDAQLFDKQLGELL